MAQSTLELIEKLFNEKKELLNEEAELMLRLGKIQKRQTEIISVIDDIGKQVTKALKEIEDREKWERNQDSYL
jgi:hypothetical protein|tara:strand:- start:148 stop:366 length:219 start_codon:yes stop_codon:yes gene_type:complete